MTLQAWLRHRRRNEALAVLAIVVGNALTNVTTELMEAARAGASATAIDPWIAEFTSALMLLLLFPLVVAGHRRILELTPRPGPRVAAHVPLFLVFTLLHVGGFVLLREWIWAFLGGPYEVDESILFGLLYEGRKDLVTFLVVLAIADAYGFILDRLQGEARFVPEPDSGPEPYRRRFLVKMLQREYLVRVEDIDWVGSARNYVMLHCGAREYPMRATMTAMARDLDPAGFLRVHRTALVNLARVRVLHGAGDGEASVELVDGTRVPVSGRHVQTLREALAGESVPGAAGPDAPSSR